MPLTLVPPRQGYSSNYRIRGHVAGGSGKRSRYINETTGTADPARAEAKRIQRANELLDELVHGKKPSHPFKEAAVNYAATLAEGATQRWAIVGHIRQDGRVSPCLIEDFGEWPVDQVGQEAVDKIIAKRFAGKAPATIDRHLITPLIGVLNWAARRGWCAPPSFERPQYRNKPRRPASAAELDRLVAAATPHFRPLLLFLSLSGARLSEALRLDWADVDLTRRWLVLRNTKRNKRGANQPGEDRGVPIHGQLVIALAALPAPKDGERTGRVFLTDPRSPGKGRPYRDADGETGGSQIKTAWRGACERAGVPVGGVGGLTVHGLRHTVATRLKELRVWEEYRQQILGHARHAMTERYEHGEAEIPRPELIEAIDQLPWIGAKLVQPAADEARTA
jgi:integrase